MLPGSKARVLHCTCKSIIINNGQKSAGDCLTAVAQQIACEREIESEREIERARARACVYGGGGGGGLTSQHL